MTANCSRDAHYSQSSRTQVASEYPRNRCSIRLIRDRRFGDRSTPINRQPGPTRQQRRCRDCLIVVGAKTADVAKHAATCSVIDKPDPEDLCRHPSNRGHGNVRGNRWPIVGIFTITEAYGSIQVDSALGRGSTFSIEMPCVEVEIDAAETDVNSPVDHADGATILVIDDNADLLDLGVEVLRYIGYSVLQASSSAEALALIDQSSSVDAVLIDVTMPAMTGPELAYPLGADRLLRKPFSEAELAMAIRAALQ